MSMTKTDRFEEVYIIKDNDYKNPIRITNFNTRLEKYPKPEIETVSWTNSNGDSIEGILFWPPSKKNSKNLPLVVDIHGGPTSMRVESTNLNGMQYYYYASLLASKGFVVMQPNYSGGTGYGDKFTQNIIGSAITNPTDDIIKGVEYLIREKVLIELEWLCKYLK